jgi:cytochrome c oxidase subunit II
MNQSSLHPAGIQALHISTLWWLMFWVCLGVFVLVMVFLMAAAFRRRPLIVVASLTTVDVGRERRMKKTVIGAVAMTVVILFVFLIASFLTGKTVSALSAPDPLTIEVVGHQWWWEIHYDDPTPSRMVTTANEIHIPIGKPALLKLFTRDVIHSFWVPNLQGKMDLIPGQENRMWIRADQVGRYEGQCAEFCGHQHAHMRFIVVAEPQDKFDAWLNAQRQPAHVPENDEEQKGQQVFLGSSCVLCHTIQGTPAAATNGPNLTHVGSRQTIAAGTIPNTKGHLGGWILDSQNIKPGNHMPPTNLNSDDLQNLLLYLESLK